MERTNEHNPEQDDTEKTTEENLRTSTKDQLEPKPGKDPNEKNESAFMKMLKKVGFSVWLAVMIIGAGLAFIAAIFLL